eukprot:m.33790 g.33790  ORF g.33790 m.33790 type:complete len:537 (-) comp14255_c1_seq4:1344-2954(-)
MHSPVCNRVGATLYSNRRLTGGIVCVAVQEKKLKEEHDMKAKRDAADKVAMLMKKKVEDEKKEKIQRDAGGGHNGAVDANNGEQVGDAKEKLYLAHMAEVADRKRKELLNEAQGNGADVYGGEGAYKEEEQAYREDQEKEKKQDAEYAAEEAREAALEKAEKEADDDEVREKQRRIQQAEQAEQAKQAESYQPEQHGGGNRAEIGGGNEGEGGYYEPHNGAEGAQGGNAPQDGNGVADAVGADNGGNLGGGNRGGQNRGGQNLGDENGGGQNRAGGLNRGDENGGGGNGGVAPNGGDGGAADSHVGANEVNGAPGGNTGVNYRSKGLDEEPLEGIPRARASPGGGTFFFLVALALGAGTGMIAFRTACTNIYSVLAASLLDFWVMMAFYWIDVRNAATVAKFDAADMHYDAYAVVCIFIMIFAAARAAVVYNIVMGRKQLPPVGQYDLIAVIGLLAQLTVLCVQVVVTKSATKTVVAGFCGTVLSCASQAWHLINRNGMRLPEMGGGTKRGRYRYGVKNRPRQGFLVGKTNAGKQF